MMTMISLPIERPPGEGQTERAEVADRSITLGPSSPPPPVHAINSLRGIINLV
jgi:hypothetical protein